MACSKLLAVVCAAWTAQALVLGARQDLADSPLGVAFPNPPRIGPLPSISVVFTTPTPTPTPTGTLSSPGSGVTSDPVPDDSSPDDASPDSSSPGPGTGTPTDMPPIPGGSTAPTSLIVPETDSPLISNDPLDSTTNPTTNRTLVITLSSVLSSLGLLLLLGAFFLLYRLKTRRGMRKPLFARGISPIDDDEIATWKVPHPEKAPELDSPLTTPPTTATAARHTKSQPSTASTLRKPPSAVIVYSNPHGTHHHRRCSSDDSYYNSPPATVTPTRKMSFDKMLPQTPIQARAPNAIPGLTDESVPGAMPFLPPVEPEGQRRLSKVRSGHHVRARSSRSGSFGGWEYGGCEGRRSHDVGRYQGHWRGGSATEVRSPQQSRGSFEGWAGGEIGRAIG